MTATLIRTPQLNIKNPETHRLAHELSRRRGETVTQTVTTALRLLEERDRREKSLDERRASIAAIQRRVAEQLRRDGLRPPTRDEINADLFDENGLPH